MRGLRLHCPAETTFCTIPPSTSPLAATVQLRTCIFYPLDLFSVVITRSWGARHQEGRNQQKWFPKVQCQDWNGHFLMSFLSSPPTPRHLLPLLAISLFWRFCWRTFLPWPSQTHAHTFVHLYFTVVNNNILFSVLLLACYITLTHTETHWSTRENEWAPSLGEDLHGWLKKENQPWRTLYTTALNYFNSYPSVLKRGNFNRKFLTSPIKELQGRGIHDRF